MPVAAVPAAPSAPPLPLPPGSKVGAPLALLAGSGEEAVKVEVGEAAALPAPEDGEALPALVPAVELGVLALGEAGLRKLVVVRAKGGG